MNWRAAIESLGVTGTAVELVGLAIALVVALLVQLTVGALARRALHRVVGSTRTTWDDALLYAGAFHRVAHALPLGVLAAAYAGDLRLAMERQSQSQSAMASCGSCGASGDAKILLQEAEIALDALRSGALEASAALRFAEAAAARDAPSLQDSGFRITPSPWRRLPSSSRVRSSHTRRPAWPSRWD